MSPEAPGPCVRRLLAVLLLACWTCSCSLLPLRPPPDITPEAGQRIARIERLNRQLDTFKGVGNLRLDGPDGRRTLRAAWVAKMPDRLRLELLGAAGTPVASVAADGTHLSAYFHDRRKGVRRRLGSDGLGTIIGVELKIAEVVSFLGGRLFLPEFRHAAVEQGALLLKEHDGVLVQKIFPAETERSPWVVESFDGRGKLRYRARLGGRRFQGGFIVPAEIRVTAGGGAELRVSVDRFWANPEVAPGAFVLQNDRSAGMADP